ncbi:sensor histidine kinase [Spirochaeta africana]|uniref:histidine kinase n=1 Tax=Spirochaeta africana (strain ATCC 700263 / DSM 8902 / Z-7692) TaxID=889378 RepID=H9UMG9_SPIAZ|nr:sensor histidine kinase [Spirochaeta africana]AFG38712.1 histidine kinase [Spirochaeta africana DSM 8902]
MELTASIHLSEAQFNLLMMHSALNVLNVLMFEIVMLEESYGASSQSAQLTDDLHQAARSLSDQAASTMLVRNIDDFIGKGERLLAEWKATLTDHLEEFETSERNITEIFDILRIRARELATRADNPDAWEDFDLVTLHHNYVKVLRAIEQNSKGRYRIVYNLAEHDQGAYLVHFVVTSHNNKTIYMPAVLQDIIRDLLANARKYTDPGGSIEAGLYDSGSEIRFVITDTGHGIPAGEIKQVIAFGQRGSNAQTPTRGGGFGLTKAYWYTRHFGGRFWIDSEPEKGTRIELRIPRMQQ